MKTLILISFLFSFALVFSQEPTEAEKKLYDLIMTYRKEKGLPEIPLSKSLTIVAQTHVKDLHENQPVKGNCNLHSWSDKGEWSSCCYTSDHAKAECMWNKPKELTSYEGRGYEISHGTYGGEATPEGALNGWKRSTPHNNVIINKGIWDDEWKAIGVGMYKGFAVVWFGKETDE
ncbi:MAG: hypothetical protein KDC84_11215 [Crocinitomicaceae bacterium]|nr:hypothetical protein [Crocinitomicaceae bacterium]